MSRLASYGAEAISHNWLVMSVFFRKGSPIGQPESESVEGPLFKKGESTGSRGTLHQVAGSFEPNQSGNAVGIGGPVTLDALLSDDGLVEHLLTSNTFVQGKLGFHDYILAQVHRNGGIDPGEVYYARRPANLPRGTENKPLPFQGRLVIVPLVESLEALNKFVAESLMRAATVWVVAPLGSVQTHLLLTFNNFFLLVEPDELDALHDLVRMPNEKAYSTGHAREVIPLLVTNYAPLLKRYGAKTIAVIALEVDF